MRIKLYEGSAETILPSTDVGDTYYLAQYTSGEYVGEFVTLYGSPSAGWFYGINVDTTGINAKPRHANEVAPASFAIDYIHGKAMG